MLLSSNYRRSPTAAARSSCSKGLRGRQEIRAQAARGRVRPLPFRRSSVRYDRREANEGHWLARFWRQLPGGNTSIFFRSWYRRVLDDRVLGRRARRAVARAFDEINEFEAQQRDYGTLIVKLYFDVSAEVQEQRLPARGKTRGGALAPSDDFIRADDPAYQRRSSNLRANTDTRWSPWRTIDGDDEHQAVLAALTAIADAWPKAMPADPPQLVARRPRRLVRGNGSRSLRSFSRLRAGGRCARRRRCAPISARASGALQPIRPADASVSSSPTMVSVRRLSSSSASSTVAPKRTWSRSSARGVDDLRLLHDLGEVGQTAVDLAQAPLAVEVIGIFRAVAERGRPRNDFDDLRPFDPNNSSYSARMPRKSFRRDEAGASAMTRLSGRAVLPKIARDVDRGLLLAAWPQRIIDDAVLDHALHIGAGLDVTGSPRST